MGGQTSEINLTFAVDILSRLFSPVIMETLSVLAILGLEIVPTPSIPVIPPRSPRPSSLSRYKWKSSLRSSTWRTTTHAFHWLLLPSDALPSYASPDGDGLAYCPVQKAIQSWATSSTSPRLTLGRNLVSSVNNTVRYLSVVSDSTRTDPYGFAPGEAIYLNAVGRPLIILNSHKAAVDLLERKSSIYSNRPVLMLCGEIIGWNNTLPLMQHGPRSREFRKYMGKLIGTRASMERFAPLLEKETAKFVSRVMADPGSLVKQIKK